MREIAKNFQRTLESYPLIVEPTGPQADALCKLVEHPGFPVLIGMLMAERQGYLAQLEQMPLRGDNVAGASVTQGLARGVARPVQVVLETFVSMTALDNESEQKS